MKRVGAEGTTPLGKILAFAAVVEVGTGFFLIVDPAMVVALLAGPNELGEGMPLSRFLGIALLALGVSCWPDRQRDMGRTAAFRGMLTYNLLIAPYLGYLGAVGSLGGLLLWPGVALHALLALLLVGMWRNERQAKTDNN
jgi:hypothetical protein